MSYVSFGCIFPPGFLCSSLSLFWYLCFCHSSLLVLTYYKQIAETKHFVTEQSTFTSLLYFVK